MTFCAVVRSCDRELIFWVDRKAPVWAIQVSPIETEKKTHTHTHTRTSSCLGCESLFCVFGCQQVIVAIISFLETMLLMYLSYKVTHTHTHKQTRSHTLTVGLIIQHSLGK